jgi:hypothetical protein
VRVHVHVRMCGHSQSRFNDIEVVSFVTLLYHHLSRHGFSATYNTPGCEHIETQCAYFNLHTPRFLVTSEATVVGGHRSGVHVNVTVRQCGNRTSRGGATHRGNSAATTCSISSGWSLANKKNCRRR